MIIPRGIIYHSFVDDLSNLLRSFICNLKNESKVKNFENTFKRFNESKYCISYPFARSALWSILKSHNFKKGDEIILPPIQIKGMLEVCKSLELKPIFVDLNDNDLNFDLKDLQKKITPNTRVILLTYLYGIVPPIDSILDKLKKKNILLIEDFSQCLFGKYKNKYVGNFGDYGIYSLSATKTLDTYGGGLLVTNNKKNYINNFKINKKYFNHSSRFFLIQKISLSLLRNFFLLRVNFFFVINFFKLFNFLGYTGYQRFVGTRKKRILTYLPKIWFSKYTSLQADHGLRFIKNVKYQNKLRSKVVLKLRKEIGEKYFCKIEKNVQNVYWQCPFFSNNYKLIQKNALMKNIDIAQPSIMLLTSIFNLKNFKANNLYDKILLIPCYHSLQIKMIKKIISVIKMNA